MNIVSDLEPQLFWKHFYNLTRIPRESGNEEGVRRYAAAFAEEQGLEYIIDHIGNVIIRKPAGKGFENAPSVALQGHMDMVCEKNSDKVFDFAEDPIQLDIKDGWLMADGTTLGADNGVAVALGLALLETDEPFGPLEVILTVDEETGLTGAIELDPANVKSRILINLDSEEDGVVYIGCAGGKNTEGHIPVSMTDAPAGGYKPVELAVTGLKGGHSGGEIHLGLGNSVKMGIRFIFNAMKDFDLKLYSMVGGGKHNAIPREFFFGLLVPEGDLARFMDFARGWETTFKTEMEVVEPGLSFSVKEAAGYPGKVLADNDLRRVVDSLFVMPHGVIRMSPVIENLVQTSTNLARVELKDDRVMLISSQRSSVDSEFCDIADVVWTVIRQAGGSAEFLHQYPGWQPDMNSELLKKAKSAYNELYGKDPEIKAIHAGLECGVIGKKFDKMDMISIGPELENVHTPGEKIRIDTVEKAWDFLRAILKRI